MNQGVSTARMLATALLVGGCLAGAGTAVAQCTFSSGSNGSDGALNVPASTTRTVALPEDGILRYTTINIPAGATVKFTRNAHNTKVVMLATGSVTIQGTIDVRGGDAVGAQAGLGGPGGFDGGAGGKTCGGRGLGPAGGYPGCVGPYGIYPGGGGDGLTNNRLLPLIGGSGGGGAAAPSQFGEGNGGGGGGGAVLIATSGTLTWQGTFIANGGSGSSANGGAGGGPGGGGSIRLIATQMDGSVPGYNYRVEACRGTISAPADRSGLPGPVVVADFPTLSITAVGPVSVPADPSGSFGGAPDVALAEGTTSALVGLAASNVPVGTAVTVAVIPADGAPPTPVSSDPLQGTTASSIATATVTLGPGRSLITAQAMVDVSLGASGPLVVGSIDGEPISGLRIAAALGGRSSVTYITASGREVAAQLD